MPGGETYDNAGAEKPIINCHTHLFTGDHVPPLLARSIVRWPFYYLVNFRWVFYFFRKYYKKQKKKFDGTNNLKARTKFERSRKFRSNTLLFGLYTIAGIYLTIQSVDILCHWIYPAGQKDPGWFVRQLNKLHAFLYRNKILLDVNKWWLQAGILLPVIAFYKSGRNLLIFFARHTVSLLRKIPGSETKKLFDRYLTIGRFAFHTKQESTMGDLEDQYPAKTGFVILPMDMQYMGAGKPAKDYRDQMAELADLKKERDNIYPFVFVDPRRMKEEGEKYFSYTVNTDGEYPVVELGKDCFIKEFIEDKKFSGFKIYPALGYYPFDPLLLPLWKYAAQKNLPILTHCVRGPMYYRGKKERAWDYHPVFRELKEPVTGREATEDDFTALLLPQAKNEEFSANFTHPMNFLCLLKKEFLAKAVEEACNTANDETRKKLADLFGIQTENNNIIRDIKYGLDDLKICFGHYGGGDEWRRYFEKDRNNHSAQLAKRPGTGIDFLFKLKNGLSAKERSLGKPEQLWKHTDWYSIISSMMLQHRNVYADISYILHSDQEILPLLKQTLQNPGLRSKVLYGTDFYVVRNHKSDKNMLADMQSGLDQKDFDQIARLNPRDFLNLPVI